MGVDLNSCKDKFLACLPKSERKGVQTFAEADEKRQRRAEKEMHKEFSNWLRLHDIAAGHARMDKKSTYTEGWPDFTVTWGTQVLFVEFKAEGGGLRDDQVKTIAHIIRTGGNVLVTSSVAHAIEVTKDTLKIQTV